MIRLKNIWNYKFTYIKFKIISLLIGFFVATVLSTMPTQTGDWGIIAASIIVTCNETISKLIYNQKKTNLLYLQSLII